MKRLSFIDSIKGFAIICVVLGHVANGYIGEGSTDLLYFNLYNLIYAFHMPLFFMVSGFLFRKAYFTENSILGNKLKTQMINLICLYFMYCLLLGVLKIFFGQFVINQVTVTDLLYIPIRPIQHYWYLYVLIIYYFVFSRSIVYRQSHWTLLAVTFVLGVLSYWIPVTLPCEIHRLFYHMFFFCLGFTMNASFSIPKNKHLFLLLVPVIVILFVLFWSSEQILKNILVVGIIIGFACSLFVWELFKQYRFLGENRFLTFIGKYSLEIYLLHSFIVTADRALLYKWRIDNSVVIVIFSTVTGVIIPVAISIISKKIKIHNILFSPYKRKA